MTTRRFTVPIAICLLLAPVSGIAADNMTHEETVVRTAYAKFAYAAQQQVIGDLAMESLGRPVRARYIGITNDDRLAAAQISFTLQDFVVGDVRTILQRKVTDFITPGDTEILETSESVNNYSDNGLETHLNGLVVRWTKAHPVPPNLDSITLDDLYKLQWKQDRPNGLWQRYAAYTVTVTFQGKTRGPYKALFLFGRDGNGNEVVEPKDTTTGSIGLGGVLAKHFFPDAFVLTRLRTTPVVTDWMAAKQAQVAGQHCSAGSGDVCCDLVKLQCAPGRDDIAEGLAKPLPVAKP